MHDNGIYLMMNITGRIIFKTRFRCPHDTIIKVKYLTDNKNINVQVQCRERLGEEFCFYRVTLNIFVPEQRAFNARNFR